MCRSMGTVRAGIALLVGGLVSAVNAPVATAGSLGVEEARLGRGGERGLVAKVLVLVNGSTDLGADRGVGWRLVD